MADANGGVNKGRNNSHSSNRLLVKECSANTLAAGKEINVDSMATVTAKERLVNNGPPLCSTTKFQARKLNSRGSSPGHSHPCAVERNSSMATGHKQKSASFFTATPHFWDRAINQKLADKLPPDQR